MNYVVSGDGEATCHVVVTDEKTGETITEPIEPDGELAGSTRGADDGCAES